jgi:hypothetical protein
VLQNDCHNYHLLNADLNWKLQSCSSTVLINIRYRVYLLAFGSHVLPLNPFKSHQQDSTLKLTNKNITAVIVANIDVAAAAEAEVVVTLSDTLLVLFVTMSSILLLFFPPFVVIESLTLLQTDIPQMPFESQI